MTPIRFDSARAFLSKSGKSDVRSVKETDISSERKVLVINITGCYDEYFVEKAADNVPHGRSLFGDIISPLLNEEHVPSKA